MATIGRGRRAEGPPDGGAGEASSGVQHPSASLAPPSRDVKITLANQQEQLRRIPPKCTKRNVQHAELRSETKEVESANKEPGEEL